MGLKRSFDEDIQEMSFKHPKQLDSSEHPDSFAEINASHRTSQKADIPGEAVDLFCESQAWEGSKDDVISDYNDKEFETSAPTSWVTSTASEEDSGSGSVLCSSGFPEFFEFDFPRHNIIQFEDTYSSLLNSSPRKEIPIGPDHQADVPVWNPKFSKQQSISYCGDVDDNGEEMKGSCVMLMPDLDFSFDVGKTKDGEPDCSCLDGGSVRCVQQHVKEAREKLRETIGHKKFVDLGFFEMGEEVAQKWTEGEEQLFHKVVYSNSVSHGKNFWVHLSVRFPSRTKWELVSYYFNVFMLRRRAAQNRSSWLEMDSDDDEWKGNLGPFFTNQDVGIGDGYDSLNEYDDDGDDDDNSSDSNDDDDSSDADNDDNDNNDGGDGNLQVGGVDVTENAKGKDHMSKGKTDSSLHDRRFDLMYRFLEKSRKFSDVQKDSCTSFKGQPYMTESYCPRGERAALQESQVNSDHGKFWHGNCDGRDRFGPPYALEPYDSKAWDATYSMGLMKSVDLLPTCNMMEDFFGTCTWNSKSSNERSIS